LRWYDAAVRHKLHADLCVVAALIAASIPFIVYLHARPLTVALLFYVVPTLYLFLRKKKPVRELFAGAVLLGIGFAFPFDVIQTASGGWLTPTAQFVFPYALFGFVPLDEMIWFFIQALFILTFYVHFFEPRKADRVGRRFGYFFLATMVAVILIAALALAGRSYVELSYSYLIAGAPMLIPIAYVLWRYPRLMPKFLKTAAFCFVLFFVSELIALHLDQWEFPGQFIGWVQVWDVRFPLEEFFYWMLVYTLFVLSMYEGVVDDRR
jgi:hypothetical protein